MKLILLDFLMAGLNGGGDWEDEGRVGTSSGRYNTSILEHFFQTQMFLGQNYYWQTIFSEPKKFSDTKSFFSKFWTQNLFCPQNCFGLTIFSGPKIFFDNFFGLNFIFPLCNRTTLTHGHIIVLVVVWNAPPGFWDQWKVQFPNIQFFIF